MQALFTKIKIYFCMHKSMDKKEITLYTYKNEVYMWFNLIVVMSVAMIVIAIIVEAFSGE